MNRSAGSHGIKSPVELTMLGKTLLNLDHIARILAPTLDVNAAIRHNCRGGSIESWSRWPAAS